MLQDAGKYLASAGKPANYCHHDTCAASHAFRICCIDDVKTLTASLMAQP